MALMERDQISLTAQEVARIRRELARPGDGTAGAEDERRFLATIEKDSPESMRPYLASRTAFFDDSVTAAQRDGVFQIVLVGAGYDGRALRFRSPETSFFELDHPATQTDKLARLRSLDIAVDDVRFGALDFTCDDAGLVLASLGHRDDLRSLFLCEGVTVYLEEPVLRGLLAALRRQAAAGSVLAVNFAVTTGDADFEAQSAAWQARLATLGERPRNRPDREEVLRLLEDEGWQPRDLVTPANAEFGARLSGALFVRAVASGGC